MKSYLDLIPISAKIHKRQNRMTRLCIIFAVFLVTAIFSMADIGVRMEQTRLLDKHSNLTFQDLLSSTLAQTLFLAATVLFLLVLIAGVLMISSSLNSNVAQMTKFFGMMRCIGMSKRQIIHFVRLEALNWCKAAVPIGVVLGIAITWGLCAALRFLVGEEFSEIPIFGISLIGIISGIVVGIVTVVIAASSPAKRAAKVSPITAVSGNSENAKTLTRAANTRFFKIETSLGINHAVSGKKNLVLMISSFALSIILFLSFWVLIQFVGYLMPQLSNASDINISSSDASNSIDTEMLAEISTMQGVERVFGRRSLFDVPAEIGIDNQLTSMVDMISFDEFDLDWLTKDKLLRKGGDILKVYGDSNYVLAICDTDNPLEIGDKIQIGDEELEVAGLLKYDPFNSDGNANGQITIITSSETFTRLTGINGYSLIMIQTTSNITDEDVTAISSILDENCTLQDRREQSTIGTYMAFQICIYGFLVIITLVTVLNIMNSISMSVSARINQYGAMRAIGMEAHQVTKMIAVEAFTYALLGCVVGCIIGLMVNKLLYDTLITNHFSYATWSMPIVPLVIILMFVLGSVIVAVYTPSKRIWNMSITDMVNEL